MIDPSWLSWWTQADLVVRSVFVILTGMSVLTWTVVLYKLLQLQRIQRLENRAAQLLQHGELENVGALGSDAPTQQLRQAALALLQRRSATAEQLQARLDGVQGTIRVAQEKWLTLLATISSSAPFIGLLGTVWGIMHALQGLTGNALTLDAVAGPVGEALIATAAGLFAAIPALLTYNFLLRWLRRINMQTAANARCIVDLLSAVQAQP